MRRSRQRLALPPAPAFQRAVARREFALQNAFLRVHIECERSTRRLTGKVMKNKFAVFLVISIGSAVMAFGQSKPSKAERSGFVFSGSSAVYPAKKSDDTAKAKKKESEAMCAIIATLAAKAKDPKLEVGTSFTTTPEDSSSSSSLTIRRNMTDGYETTTGSGLSITVQREGTGWRATDSLGNGWTITPESSGSYRTTLYTKAH
jgi:hypothetical protein